MNNISFNDNEVYLHDNQESLLKFDENNNLINVNICDYYIVSKKLYNCKVIEKKNNSNCFVYLNSSCCKVFKKHIKKDCENCKFYKSVEQYNKERKKVLERIDTLEDRDYILDKYNVCL